MSLRALELNALLTEFQMLHEQPFRQFWRMGPESYTLGIGRHFVLLDFSRQHNWVALMTSKSQAMKPDALCMWVRKHFQGQKLLCITQASQDRIWHWQWSNGLSMVCELSGRHSNFFVLQAEHIAQVLRPDHSQRQLVSGQAYLAPPGPEHWSLYPVRWGLDELPATGVRSERLLQEREKWLLQTHLQTQWRSVERALKRKLRQSQQRLEGLQADLDALEQAQIWQRRGELLQGAYGQVTPGQASVEVLDFYDPEAAKLRIPLDPRLDLNQNIQRCFQRSKKYERAAERALEKWDAAELKNNETVELWTQFEKLKNQLWPPDDLFQKELQEKAQAQLQDFFERFVPPQQKARRAFLRLPYRLFCAQNGDEIRVGRSAKDNERLCFQFSRGRDAWLHVRNGPGAHVVVPLQKNQDLPEQSLLDAATLALYYAETKETQAEITVSRVKYLKRIPGAPGRVQISEQKTLFIRSEPERLQRLLESSQSRDAN